VVRFKCGLVIKKKKKKKKKKKEKVWIPSITCESPYTAPASNLVAISLELKNLNFYVLVIIFHWYFAVLTDLRSRFEFIRRVNRAAPPGLT